MTLARASSPPSLSRTNSTDVEAGGALPPSHAVSPPLSGAEDESWTLVGSPRKHLEKEKPKKQGKSRVVAEHASLSVNGSRRNSGSKPATPHIASPNLSRRSSLTPANANEDFASFRKSAHNSKRSKEKDWRQASLETQQHAAHHPPQQRSTSPQDKEDDSPSPTHQEKEKKSKSGKQRKHKEKERASTPPQPTLPTHQVGSHNRFSLGPVDFPNLTFRRIMWASERAAQRSAAQQLQISVSAPSSTRTSPVPMTEEVPSATVIEVSNATSPIEEIEVVVATTPIVLVEPATPVAMSQLEQTVTIEQPPVTEAEEETIPAASSVVFVEPVEAPAAAASESTAAPATKPKKSNKKKSKKASESAASAAVETPEEVEAEAEIEAEAEPEPAAVSEEAEEEEEATLPTDSLRVLFAAFSGVFFLLSILLPSLRWPIVAFAAFFAVAAAFNLPLPSPLQQHTPLLADAQSKLVTTFGLQRLLKQSSSQSSTSQNTKGAIHAKRSKKKNSGRKH